MEIRKIVIATDGSPSSAAALDFGLELALDRGAEAVVLHVIATREASHVFGVDRAEPPTREELIAGSPALAQGALFAAGHAVDATLELVAADGTQETADATLGVASGRDADLIVMGTRGQGPLATAVIGSVSNALLRAASTTTVIVVRAPESEA